MFITYRRTGGIFALLAVAAAGLVAVAVTIAAAATVLIVGTAVAAAALGARAVVTAFGRPRRVPPPTPRGTIETTVVYPARAAVERDLARMDSDAG
jgi:hypothetical protein